MTGAPEVSMRMNTEGARRWAGMTKANIGKAIAIVLDGSVYSAPRVNGEITGGSSAITGNFTIEDTKDLANTLKSGRMPAPARIVQEDIVGPSLGAQSIQQGLISFVIAFVILMVYMIILYNVIPGLLANMLCCSTSSLRWCDELLPDRAYHAWNSRSVAFSRYGGRCNVLIYERAKEELQKG